MKRLLIAAVALSALPFAAQAADTASGDVTLSATAPNTCAIRGIAANTGNGALTPFSNTTGGAATASSTLALDNASVIDTTTATALANTNVLTLNAFCNYASHSIQLRSANGGLTNVATTSTVGDFNRRIAYNADLAAWGSSTASVAATGTLTSGTASQVTGTAITVAPAVNTTTATVTIATVAAAGTPLLQGSYGDTLTVRLGTAFGS
jgi:hypothetical protein